MVVLFGALCVRAGAAEPGTVWVVSNGFHSALVLRRSDVPFQREIGGDASADFLMFGWGDADFYRRRINPWTCLKAICWPSPSIIHVVSIRGSVAARFRQSDVFALSLSQSQLRNLARGIAEAFARDSRGRCIFVTRGYFPESRFYEGSERFYFPKMCNVWVAQKLRGGGVPVNVPSSVVASELMWQVRKLGTRQQSLRRPVDAF